MSETSRNDTSSDFIVETTGSKSIAETKRIPISTVALATVNNPSSWKTINFSKVAAFAKKLDSFGRRLARGLWRLVMMGIALHVAEHFAPELREHIPLVFQIADGGMMIINFIFEWGIKLITAIVSGNFFSVNGELKQAVRELINVFITWATSI